MVSHPPEDELCQLWRFPGVNLSCLSLVHLVTAARAAPGQEGSEKPGAALAGPGIKKKALRINPGISHL